MIDPAIISTGSPPVDTYLAWRRKSRVLRKYGGPLVAIVVFLSAVLLMVQMHKRQIPALDAATKEVQALRKVNNGVE